MPLRLKRPESPAPKTMKPIPWARWALMSGVAVGLLAAPAVARAQSAKGMLFQQWGHKRVYIMNRAGQLQWITSGPLFQAMGESWGRLVHVTTLPGPVVAPITLVRLNGHNKVYLIQNNQLHWVPSSAIFNQLALQWDQIATVNDLPYGIGSAAGVPSPTPTAAPLTIGYGEFALSGTTPGSGWYDLTHHASQLSTIAPLWYQAAVTGTVTPTVSPTRLTAVVRQAAQEQIAVWPTVQMTTPLPAHWGSSASASQLVTQLLSIAQSQGYSGYTLDFENLSTDNGPTFATFVHQLGTALHQQGLKLMVDVLPLPDVRYSYAQLAQSANYLDVLAYPEYTTGTPTTTAPNPGPTAGLPWVQAAVQAASQVVAPHQLVLGIAAYGQSWTYTNQGFQGGVAIPDRVIQESLVNQPGQSVYDPTQGELEISTGPLATAPPAPLDTNVNAFSPAVQNLQFLLNTILLRYQVAQHQTTLPPLATDGVFGPATETAVAQFQTAYGVQTSTPGLYDQATANMLQQVIETQNIGDTVSWDENTTAAQSLINLAQGSGLAGISMWRLGYQSPDFWPMLQQSGE